MEIIEVIKDGDKLSFLFYDVDRFKIYHIVDKDEAQKTYNNIRYNNGKFSTFDEIVETVYDFISDKTCEEIDLPELLKIEALKESTRLKPYLRDYQINSILDE